MLSLFAQLLVRAPWCRHKQEEHQAGRELAPSRQWWADQALESLVLGRMLILCSYLPCCRHWELVQGANLWTPLPMCSCYCFSYCWWLILDLFQGCLDFSPSVCVSLLLVVLGRPELEWQVQFWASKRNRPAKLSPSSQKRPQWVRHDAL